MKTICKPKPINKRLSSMSYYKYTNLKNRRLGIIPPIEYDTIDKAFEKAKIPC